ncbi:MAG: hypothetical protein GY769_01600 [bacterium]|nr:hypothetical protein [bacterium]
MPAKKVSSKAEATLTWLLRCLGGLTLLALVPMVMPTDWMAVVNDRLGLEPLPRSPLTEYLTRSLCAIYALVGALTLYVARDVRRYAGFVAFAGRLTVLLGVFLSLLGPWAGLPAVWVWWEGPPTIAVGVWMYWLARRVGDT